MKIKVYSEIGRLRKVLVHRPGKEVQRLYPDIFTEMLFDDVMYLKEAQEEHDAFTAVLRAEEVEVFYIEKLVGEVLDANPKLRSQFIKEFISEAGVDHPILSKAIFDFWNQIESNHELASTMIGGITKFEVKPKFTNSIIDYDLEHNPNPFYIKPICNILFQRDPISNVYDGMNVHIMAQRIRQRESIFYRYLVKYHPEFKDINPVLNLDHDGSIEGGDILVLNKETIWAGMSERTTPAALSDLSARLFKRYPDFKRMIVTDIPKGHATMHIDTIFTQADRDLFIMDAQESKKKQNIFIITKGSNGEMVTNHYYEYVVEILKKYISKKLRVVLCSGDHPVYSRSEQWTDGVNCLAVRPNRLIAYNRNVYTNKTLRAAGVEVIEIPSSELSRGRGGPRCLTMPIERDEV